MISSFARPRPTTWGSREEPPRSGTRPSRVSGSPTTASSESTRRSQASASSSAPPRHAPWIWATTGLVISSARFQASRQPRRNARRLPGWVAAPASAATSIPAENTLPAPRRLSRALPAGVHMLILLGAGALIYWLGVQAPNEDGRPPAYQSVLLVTGLLLLWAGLLTTAKVLGADLAGLPAGALVWTAALAAV